MAMRYYVPFPDWDGAPYKPLPRRVLRIGDADRDAAAADLGDHYAAGRLTLDELHDRLGEVLAATTHGQLWKVMADLPGSAPSRPQAWPGGTARTPSPRSGDRGRDTPSDRAGRVAAVALLILAMVIWLFTAFLFARHGYYAHPGPGSWPAPK
ncbi:MAG: DUF1707 domain-containing protein [Nocardiopsaceae bacterium]|nr:DUF1707 domain-containing protein [Nocardiopsaceae bacterium]